MPSSRSWRPTLPEPKTLARQLASVEGTKTKEIGRRELFEGGFKRAAVQAAQGEALPAKVLEYGRQIRSSIQAETKKHVQQALKAPIRQASDLTEQLKKLPGYTYQEDPITKQGQLRHTATGSRFELAELKPGGMAMKETYDQAVQRTAQRDQTQNRGSSSNRADLHAKFAIRRLAKRESQKHPVQGRCQAMQGRDLPYQKGYPF